MKLRRGIVTSVIALISAFTALASLAAPPPKFIIIAQPDSPVEITSYSGGYQARSTYSSEGIAHSLGYRSRGTSKVVAIRFGLVSFDVFNQFLTKTGGISLDTLVPGKIQKGQWVSSSYGDFSFLTGLAYVDIVRLEDGTIWKADEATVLDEIRKLESDFDSKLLKGKGDPTP